MGEKNIEGEFKGADTSVIRFEPVDVVDIDFSKVRREGRTNYRQTIWSEPGGPIATRKGPFGEEYTIYEDRVVQNSIANV